MPAVPPHGFAARGPVGYGVRVMHDLGKMLFILGLVLAVAGAVLWKTGGLGGLGRLPGDISVQRGNGTFYFPIMTCLVMSAVLTLLAWLFRR